MRASPRRTARVRFPCSVSVGMSRRLFATRIAEATAPTPTAPATPNPETVPVWVYSVPRVAIRPKKTKT